MKRNRLVILFAVMALGLWLSGCASMQPSEKPYKLTPQGMVIWNDEYEFKPPPKGWKLVQVESGGEFGFGFLRTDPGPFPSQSMFVYDEEPFGCSGNLDNRQEEFFKRFLWTTALNMKVLEKKPFKAVGVEGLAVTVEGSDPIKKEKARAKVVFAKRGERVVTFYMTQWRPIDGTFDPSAFEVFDNFIASFKYLKKSFYETL
jgi:hypothetical protein